MNTRLRLAVLPICIGLLRLSCGAQVNSGSDGSDGALNPTTTNFTIDMQDHPDGIYKYSSVNIGTNVFVTITPNAKNKPVIWLVQGDCNISGGAWVYLDGNGAPSAAGGTGGPGGYSGGNSGTTPSAGQGPGAGASGASYAPNASYGGLGSVASGPPGPLYGNIFILPLLGGSGGGGSNYYSGAGSGGGGGGGAIMIVCSGKIRLDGRISARGGGGAYIYNGGIAGGCGSGGAVRLVASSITGTGSIDTSGGQTGSQNQSSGGVGRVRFDSYDNRFAGAVTGVFSQGFQPIIIPAAGQGIQLAIQSIGGVAAPTNPSAVVGSPDVTIPAQQTNPVSIVVGCTNVPLNSQITVVVQPANGTTVQAVGINNVGTLAASAATIPVNMPRGGGTLYAKTVTGVAGTVSATSGAIPNASSLTATGWTADGERFVAMEIQASLGGKQSITYLTKAGKRYPVN